MAEQPGAPQELAAPQKNKTKLLVIIVLAVLLTVGLSAVGAWFFLTRQADEQQVQQPQVAVTQQQAVYETLEPFSLNLRSERRKYFLQVSVALMARDQGELDALRVHTPVLRDGLGMLFSSQDFDDLRKPEGIEMLKHKATITVQELAQRETGKPVVESVLFTNFVMQ